MWVAGRREGVRPIRPARVLRTSVWLCPTRNPARELLFLQGGPAAQEWRTAEGGRPEKGQLPVFGGLGKACGLFNFSISTPSPQHLRIVPLLPASLLLPDTCTNRCCSVALAAHWRPKNPSCASNPCLDMLVTGGHSTAPPPEAASGKPQPLDCLSQARGSQESVAGTLGVPECSLSHEVSDTRTRDSGQTGKGMGRCRAPGHHTMGWVPQTLGQD